MVKLALRGASFHNKVRGFSEGQGTEIINAALLFDAEIQIRPDWVEGIKVGEYAKSVQLLIILISSPTYFTTSFSQYSSQFIGSFDLTIIHDLHNAGVSKSHAGLTDDKIVKVGESYY